jgi:hypothetical protein
MYLPILECNFIDGSSSYVRHLTLSLHWLTFSSHCNSLIKPPFAVSPSYKTYKLAYQREECNISIMSGTIVLTITLPALRREYESYRLLISTAPYVKSQKCHVSPKRVATQLYFLHKIVCNLQSTYLQKHFKFCFNSNTIHLPS